MKNGPGPENPGKFRWNVRVGAHMGPYGPDFVKKIINFNENGKIINKDIKVVKLKILKVKTWFCDKDPSSLDSID